MEFTKMMRFIPGETKTYKFKTEDINELALLVTACKMCKISFHLEKDDGNFIVFYTVKSSIQEGVKEFILEYRKSSRDLQLL